MVSSLIDLLTRRSRAHLQNARTTAQGAESVARLVAPILGWNEDDIRREVDVYLSLANVEFSAAGLRLA